MSTNNSTSPLRRPPHLTLNSGSGGDFLARMAESSDSTSNTSRPRTHQSTSPTAAMLPPIPPGTPRVYGQASVPPSTEMLFPPTTSRPPTRERERGGYQEMNFDSFAIPGSGLSSRRTSVSSDLLSRDSRYGLFHSPFDHSRTPSRAGSMDDGHLNTQTVAEKYNIMPSDGLLVYPEDVEKDDYLHNPQPGDDKQEDCNIFTKRGIVNVGGLALIVIGILILFVGYPALTYIKKTTGTGTGTSRCDKDSICLSDKFPLLQNVRTGLIDPDTPDSAKSKTAKDGTKLELVFSDEFSKPGRTFYDGDDPFWQAVDIWYGATEDIEWYDPDAVSTENGTLNLRMDAFQSHNLNYRSGMLQSWNKLCFKGGSLEASISLPGKGSIPGFWPGFWAMGNLGRPGYTASTEGLWPYSYWDQCDAGITANQSAPDGLSRQPGMRLPACTCADEDHPSPGNSRSAPEIDVLEASVGFLGPDPVGGATGSASQSFQVAPFDIWYQPDYDYLEVYDNEQSMMNTYRGGVYQQALSGVTWLNNDWYDGKGFQKYGFEYEPGGEGHITWFVGDQYTWKIDHRALRPNGNIGQRVMPEEPMSIVMNFGMSMSFAQVFLQDLAELMPVTMRFDYVRIYQDPNNVQMSCDPVGYPTTAYIGKHPEPYRNPNLTNWAATDYEWPKNTLVNDCQA